MIVTWSFLIYYDSTDFTNNFPNNNVWLNKFVSLIIERTKKDLNMFEVHIEELVLKKKTLL